MGFIPIKKVNMKHTISSGSWHYSFIQRFNSFHPKSGFAPTDICEYRGKFIKAFLNCLMVYALLAIILAVPLTLTGAWLLAAVNTGIWAWSTFPGVLQAFWSLMLGGTILIGIAALADYLNERICEKRQRQEAQGIVEQPSTAKVMYQSFKQKFCVPVEFE